MFWTAFIWGLGVSLGACVGLIAFFLIKTLLDKTTYSELQEETNKYNEKVLETLLKRNEISTIMCETLDDIRETMDKSGEKQHT